MAELKSEKETALSSVEPLGDAVLLNLDGRLTRMKLRSLPEDKIAWIENGRRQVYDRLLNGTEPMLKNASYHLPMITTINDGELFPFNCCNKGVGYLPKKKYLSHFVDFFRDVHEDTRGKPWRESLRDRLEAARQFYFDRDKIDYRVCTTLEIFEKKTFANLNRTPKASLLFTGDGPEYTSFQLNTVVEVIGQDDPRHTFVMLMRTLFESESFHIHQPQFPHAYLFWICEVLDKTPFRVDVQAEKVQYKSEQGGLRWEDAALEGIGRAPSLIQKHIQEVIENYARQRGFSVITPEIVREAKEQFMPQ